MSLRIHELAKRINMDGKELLTLLKARGWVAADTKSVSSTVSKIYIEEIEKEFAARDAELQKMGKQVRDLQAQVEKESVTMSEADKRNKERDLANLNREFQRSQREFREDLNMRKNEELAVVQERANKVIKDIAEAEKFDLIVQDAVFASNKIDITDKVLKALGADK